MKIFFSYGHDEHSEFVSRLAGEIEKRSNNSIQVWIDSNKITRDSHWRERITDGIIDSDSVIAFLSSYSSREASVCRDELSIALVSKHGMIRTILLEKPGKKFTPPSRVSEYQWGDLSDYPKMKAQGEEAFSAYIEQEADKIIALVNSDEMKQYAEDVQALRRSFHMPDIDTWTKFDTLIEKELIGREWLFKHVQGWEEDEEESQVLLICGKPGAGKSMFSAHLQMRDTAVVAAFPCDCRYSEYKTTKSIIMQIAYRLALRLPDYRRVVLERLNDPQYNLDRDSIFEDLILQPLSMMNIDGNRAVMVIVVDALDEAENDSLADFISRNADSLKKYVRFLVTSRKVPAIVERFSRFKQIDIDEEEEATKADLAAYYESRLGEKLKGNPEKEAFIQRLIENSGGVFTYAECVTENILKYIEQGKFTVNDYPLPAGIDALFRDTLDRGFHRQGADYTDKDYADRWRTPLGMILASPEPMPISTLRSLMNWKNTDLKDFRRPLFSLLTETDGKLTLFHKSFGEWLETTNTSYAVSREDGISDLAEACFNIYTDCQDDMDEYMLLYTTQFLRESQDRKHKKYYQRISQNQEYVDHLFKEAGTLDNKYAYARAIAFYSELLLIYKELTERNPDNLDYLRNYSMSLERMAWIYEKRKELNRASDYYEKVLAVSRELKDRYPDSPEYLRDYSFSLMRIADGYLFNSYGNNPFDYYKEALAIDKGLKDRYPDNPGYLQRYSSSLKHVAWIYQTLDEIDCALEYYEEVLAIKKELKDLYPDNIEFIKDYSDSVSEVAKTYESRSEPDLALEYYEKALAISLELKDRYPKNPDCLYFYSASLESIAYFYFLQDELDLALEYYEKSLAIKHELKEQYPENLDYLKTYCSILILIAVIYKEQNEQTRQLEYLEKNFAICQELKDRYPDNLEILKDYSNSLRMIANMYESQNEFDSALEYHQKALAIDQELKDRYPENPDLLDLFLSLQSIAGIYEARKETDNALKYYEKTLAIHRELKDRYPNNTEYLHFYSSALERIAVIYEKRKELDRALEYYEKILLICKERKNRYPNDPVSLQDYSVSLKNVSRINKKITKREKK